MVTSYDRMYPAEEDDAKVKKTADDTAVNSWLNNLNNEIQLRKKILLDNIWSCTAYTCTGGGRQLRADVPERGHPPQQRQA